MMGHGDILKVGSNEMELVDFRIFKREGDAVYEGIYGVNVAKVREILAARDGKHPNDGLSAGCFFKNIPDPKEKFGKLPAGKLLEEIGAKGMAVGGAKVFDKHANIIVNTGAATSKEIRQLADILKEKVKARFGIELQEEVIQLGRF